MKKIMSITFYDRNGIPIAYTDDDCHIFYFSGEAVGYIHNDSIYGYHGKHLGFYETGWVRDHSGACVFFTETASGLGPVKPVKGIKPIKSVKSIKQIKSVKQIRPVRPVRQLFWSNLSGRQFFNQ